jgi:hypothetical protein
LGLLLGMPLAFGSVSLGLPPKAQAVALTKDERDKLTPDQVIEMLKRGNERFRAGKMQAHDYLAQKRATAGGQYPAGPHAADGARSYIVDGHMTGGFAFLAYPAEYRKTGVMSFPINQDGQLFQKDLGAQTAELAESLTSFDPDPRWSPVQ